jgi:hypothetical protein
MAAVLCSQTMVLCPSCCAAVDMAARPCTGLRLVALHKTFSPGGQPLRQ